MIPYDQALDDAHEACGGRIPKARLVLACRAFLARLAEHSSPAARFELLTILRELDEELS